MTGGLKSSSYRDHLDHDASHDDDDGSPDDRDDSDDDNDDSPDDHDDSHDDDDDSPDDDDDNPDSHDDSHDDDDESHDDDDDRRKFCLARDPGTGVSLLQKALLLDHLSIVRLGFQHFYCQVKNSIIIIIFVI